MTDEIFLGKEDAGKAIARLVRGEIKLMLAICNTKDLAKYEEELNKLENSNNDR